MGILASFGSPLSDLVNYPFRAYRSMPIDPLSLKLIGFLPVIAFIALLLAAIWRQSKKFPVRAISDSKITELRKF
tara:strand:- start:202 stop:426 length:225 start_codon:yes stop_codon:yes gene_type:complete